MSHRFSPATATAVALALFTFSLGAAAQTSSSTTAASTTAAAPAATAAPAQTTASAPAKSAAPMPYTPNTLIGGGVGVGLPGTTKFAYGEVSKYLAQDTYASAVNEYTLVNKQVQTCGLAGITKIVYRLGASILIGTTGLAGACEAPAGSAITAGSAQGFLAWHIGKSHWLLLVTAEKTSGSSLKITFGPKRAD